MYLVTIGQLKATLSISGSGLEYFFNKPLNLHIEEFKANAIYQCDSDRQ